MQAQTDHRPDRRTAALTPGKREEIVRRYWMKGELTPLGVANWLAGQKTQLA